MVHAKQRALSCLSLFAVVFVIGCRSQKPTLGSGNEWRSWTPEQRQLYVSGYLDGHSSGQADLCRTMDERALIIKLRDKIGDDEDPCMHFRTLYSRAEMGHGVRGYTGTYVSVIDDFYKHPECRVMPTPFFWST